MRKIKRFAKNIFDKGYQAVLSIQRLLATYFGYEVLVLGDSHAKVFNNPNFLLKFPLIYFNVISAVGATASGLENPRSKTQAYKIFNDALQPFTGRKVILLLGEVDTGFVIWYRAKIYNENIDEMAEVTIKTYQRYIDLVSSQFDVIVISCPLPTISDNSPWGDVANARKEVTATQEERTLLAVNFNSSIESYCKSKKIKYINIDQQSLGPGMVVRKELLNKNPTNHHYNQNSYAKLLAINLVDYL